MPALIKTNTADLKLGMYVSRLDRPWLDTPFTVQGFTVESPDELLRLQQHCKYVFVDIQKSIGQPLAAKPEQISRPRRSKEQIFTDRTLKTYRDSTTWAEEYPRAQLAVEALSAAIGSVFAQVAAGGALDVIKVKKSVEPMIDSIIRNPDGCIWLAGMKQRDNYTFQHSVGTSIWAVALGRQLGLPKPDLRSLAVGGLLLDVGKIKLNEELLQAQRTLSGEDFAEIKRHVNLSVEMIQDSGLMNQDVLDMAACHHERHDGGGYPDGLSGDDIPVFARLAAIVDCYDAITSHRSYARAIPPATAVKMLYEWRDAEFQGELVEEFIQTVGIYPAGSLVELSSGEVAVVMADYRTRRLRPKVKVLLGANKEPPGEVRVIDMQGQLTAADGQPLEIAGSLEPEAFGIDMAAIQL
jgi:HD-GYP domain-containing protein (c-di-GMP phosphodiesterase class II)